MTTGFVVAGGRSLRMGRDKALLPWGAATLLDHAADRLAGVCGAVRVLSGLERRYSERGLPVEADVVDAGPLGGVLTGLLGLESEDELGLFLAVDLPFASEGLLAFLLREAPGHDAVVPVTADGAHPLCAVYRGTCAGPIRRRIDAGELKMTAFWPDVRVREVGEADLRRFGDPARLLLNLNRLEDYAAFRAP